MSNANRGQQILPVLSSSHCELPPPQDLRSGLDNIEDGGGADERGGIASRTLDATRHAEKVEGSTEHLSHRRPLGRWRQIRNDRCARSSPHVADHRYARSRRGTHGAVTRTAHCSVRPRERCLKSRSSENSGQRRQQSTLALCHRLQGPMHRDFRYAAKSRFAKTGCGSVRDWQSAPYCCAGRPH